MSLSQFVFSRSTTKLNINGAIKGLKEGEKIVLWLYQDTITIDMGVSSLNTIPRPIDSTHCFNEKFSFTVHVPKGPRLFLITYNQHLDVPEKLFFFDNNENVHIVGEFFNRKELRYIKSKKLKEFVSIPNIRVHVSGSQSYEDFFSLNTILSLYEKSLDEYFRYYYESLYEEYLPSNGNKVDSLKIKEYPRAKVQSTFNEYNELLFSYLQQNWNNKYIPAAFRSQLREHPFPHILEIYNALPLYLKESYYGRIMRENAYKIAIGQMAPEFLAMDVNRKHIQYSRIIKDYKLTLLDFWASWCANCVKKFPHELSVFEKYKDKGFNIVSVSMDTDYVKWKNAVEKYKLPWLQISDLKGTGMVDGIGRLYNIHHSLPFNVLIDDEGRIVAKDLHGAVLEEKLAEIFGQE